MKNILILGGDGYLGWPTAMYLSKKGYHVTIIDNLSRRNNQYNSSLFVNPNMIDRCKLWYEITGLQINAIVGDLMDFSILDKYFKCSR